MINVIEKRKSRYQEKINYLDQYYSKLTKWFLNSEPDQIDKDSEKAFAIYHVIQLSIEVVSDLSAMIVKESGFVPKDNYSNFENLYQKEIISKKMKLALNKLNGLRNRIVHGYNGIIDKVLWDSITENHSYLLEFKNVVKKWLKTQ